MDELDLFRDFRTGVTSPSPEAERRASLRLAEAIEPRRPAQPRAAHALRGRSLRLTLAVVALAAAAAATLFVSSPWKTSPGFLERAEAALTVPRGTILHIRWQATKTSLVYGCKVTVRPSEVWADQVSPKRYRAIEFDTPDPTASGGRALACAVGPPNEVGGTLEPRQLFRFLPPRTLEYYGEGAIDWDIVGTLRKALANGDARDEGKVRLDGRIVERIRVCPPGRCQVPSYWYVDPKTFSPVRLDDRAFFGDVEFAMVTRILTYEYLPRTAANIALADIRAQHPDAIG